MASFGSQFSKKFQQAFRPRNPPPRTISSYDLPGNVQLRIVMGSVVEFAPLAEDRVGAIVNAANEGCLGGGGVDGAISDAGGPNLQRDRMRLPILSETDSDDDDDDKNEKESEEKFAMEVSKAEKKKLRTGIRCAVGTAVTTGPGEYGSLACPYVIHAVGPMYFGARKREDVLEGHALLQGAYASALTQAQQHGVQDVAFALLSSGIFRGSVPLSHILRIAVKGVYFWAKEQEALQSDGNEDVEPNSVETVSLFAFTKEEAYMLSNVSQKLFRPDEVAQEGSSERRKRRAPKTSPPAKGAATAVAKQNPRATQPKADEEMADTTSAESPEIIVVPEDCTKPQAIIEMEDDDEETPTAVVTSSAATQSKMADEEMVEPAIATTNEGTEVVDVPEDSSKPPATVAIENNGGIEETPTAAVPFDEEMAETRATANECTVVAAVPEESTKPQVNVACEETPAAAMPSAVGLKDSTIPASPTTVRTKTTGLEPSSLPVDESTKAAQREPPTVTTIDSDEMTA